jgi:hypothetical protein
VGWDTIFQAKDLDCPVPLMQHTLSASVVGDLNHELGEKLAGTGTGRFPLWDCLLRLVYKNATIVARVIWVVVVAFCAEATDRKGDLL